MFTISRRDVEDAYGFADRALQRARDYEGGGKPVAVAVKTAEVMAGSFVMGAAAGYFGGPGGELNVPGTKMPVDLTVGLTLKLAEFAGWFGKISGHMGNVGDGALAFYAGRFGVGVGQSHKKTPAPATGAAMPESRVAGTLPEPQQDIVGGGAPLTEAELIALASRGR